AEEATGTRSPSRAEEQHLPLRPRRSDRNMTVTTESATAHVVEDDAEALEIATSLAERFAVDAAARDAERRLPRVELEELSASGLLAITVPREHGGAEVRVRTLVEVFRQLAVAAPSIAQIPHSHFVFVNALRETGSAEQQRFFYRRPAVVQRYRSPAAR